MKFKESVDCTLFSANFRILKCSSNCNNCSYSIDNLQHKRGGANFMCSQVWSYNIIIIESCTVHSQCITAEQQFLNGFDTTYALQ